MVLGVLTLIAFCFTQCSNFFGNGVYIIRLKTLKQNYHKRKRRMKL